MTNEWTVIDDQNCVGQAAPYALGRLLAASHRADDGRRRGKAPSTLRFKRPGSIQPKLYASAHFLVQDRTYRRDEGQRYFRHTRRQRLSIKECLLASLSRALRVTVPCEIRQHFAETPETAAVRAVRIFYAVP